MTPETKHALILGGGLIVAVVLGIIVYKKYEASSQADQAASDQASQDTLAYIESMALGGAYPAFGGGAGGSSLTLPSPPATQSLADEITQLEQAFGFAAPASTSPAAPASSGSSSDSGSTSRPIDRRVVSGSGSPNEPHPGYVLADLHRTLEEPVGAEGSYIA